MTNGSRPRRALTLMVALLGFLAFGLVAPAIATADDDSQVSPEPGSHKQNDHPSGKDRHEDKGTQGQSPSNPDGGGEDKPYSATGTGDGAGGVDQADQDGNNGCGNDDDFEDDNNGNCGGKKKAKQPDTSVKGTTAQTPSCTTCIQQGGTDAEVLGITAENTGSATAAPVETEVLGVTATRAEAAAVSTEVQGATAARAAGPSVGTPTAVLGNVITRAAAAPLARTGLALGFVALLGLGSVGGGQALRRAARK